MRIRQMGFSSRLKAHRHMLTLETLQFIVEFLEDGNARMAAWRAGIPETYASRQGAWLKKLPIVQKALESDLDEKDRQRLRKSLLLIREQMDKCKEILNLDC